MSSEGLWPTVRALVVIALAVIMRPSLWVTAARQALTLTPARWWTRAPWLPLPDMRYLEFRLLTAYGDSHHPPRPDDVVAYLEWCRSWKHLVSADG